MSVDDETPSFSPRVPVENVYAAARELQSAAAHAGDIEWADRLDDAIAGGSTGTEILLRLRRALEVPDTHADEGALGARAAQIRAEITRVVKDEAAPDPH